MKVCILFNPLAGNKKAEQAAKSLAATYSCDVSLTAITEISDYKCLLADLGSEDLLVICGGDGTLNRFVNETDGLEIACDISYLALGTGNDFLNDIEKANNGTPVPVKQYLSNLPFVEVKGKKYLLLHAGIADFDATTPLEDYMPEDFVHEALDPDVPYFEDVTVIAGHVPTYEIAGADRGKIYYGNGSILIDCGAAFDEPLACLRLEDGKEFYVA